MRRGAEIGAKVRNLLDPTNHSAGRLDLTKKLAKK